jgi:CO dehydrogenase maturation factor
MEHLSRRTSETIDHMILVSDPSIRGLRSAKRIHALIKELDLDVANISLVVSRAPDPLPAPLEEEIQGCGIPFLGKIPSDKTIEEYDLAIRPLTELPEESPAVEASERILEDLKLA